MLNNENVVCVFLPFITCYKSEHNIHCKFQLSMSALYVHLYRIIVIYTYRAVLRSSRR